MLFLSIVRHMRLGRGSPSIPLFHVHRSNLCKCERFHLGIQWSRGPFLQLFVRFHTALKVRQPWWGFLLLGPPTSQFSNLKRCENCVVTYCQCFLLFFFVPALMLGFWCGWWCRRLEVSLAGKGGGAASLGRTSQFTNPKRCANCIVLGKCSWLRFCGPSFFLSLCRFCLLILQTQLVFLGYLGFWEFISEFSVNN